MYDEELIKDAVQFLAEKLASNAPANEALEHTAKDFDIPIRVLAARFEKRFGSKPDTYEPPVNTGQLSRKPARRRAVELSHSLPITIEPVDPEVSKRHREYIEDPSKHAPAGTIFSWAGREYALSSYQLGARGWTVLAVPCDPPDGRRAGKYDGFPWLDDDWPHFATREDCEEWIKQNTVLTPFDPC